MTTMDDLPATTRRELLINRLTYDLRLGDDTGEIDAHRPFVVDLLELRAKERADDETMTPTERRRLSRRTRDFKRISGKPVAVALADAEDGIDSHSVATLAKYFAV